MEKEFNLSKARCRSTILEETLGIEEEWWYPEKKVKEFIRLLKEELPEELLTLTDENKWGECDRIPQEHIIDVIDKLAGDKLI